MATPDCESCKQIPVGRCAACRDAREQIDPAVRARLVAAEKLRSDVFSATLDSSYVRAGEKLFAALAAYDEATKDTL